VEMENIARKSGLQINQEKTKYMIVKRKNTLKQNKIKLRVKNTIIDKMSTYALETWILTNRDRKKMNIFERKVYR
jgi:hypothetical protein